MKAEHYNFVDGAKRAIQFDTDSYNSHVVSYRKKVADH